MKFSFLLLILLFSQGVSYAQYDLNKAFRDYWFDGKAEISTYELEQSRYGKLHKGEATLIYVKESSLKDLQVKPNNYSNINSVSVLKLNSTKKFITGIYPYSTMNSNFMPLKESALSIKNSYSCQEWCGHSYIQLNNRSLFEINSHSYFESQNDANVHLPKNLLEDGIWTRIRINPKELPVGELSIIPSFEFFSFYHLDVQAYKAIANITEDKDVIIYKLYYPSLERRVTIKISDEAPYYVLYWEEEFQNKPITCATRIKTTKLSYWNYNRPEDLSLHYKLYQTNTN